MAVDPAFTNAGQKEGIEIWRIKQLQLLPLRSKDYGSFYTGDAYIVLASFGSPKATSWNVHFWLGDECSQDESTVAAYKTVELDDHLGGTPIQFREVQSHESKKFLQLFKKGIRYLSGGFDSALKNVDPDKFEERMFHIKGKRQCRVSQVPKSVSSLNQGDVFVLDMGRTIYVWTGPHSSRSEKIKGAEFARQIRDDERGGKATIKLLDTEWNSDRPFYAALGAQPGCQIKEDSQESDSAVEKTMHHQHRLYNYRVSDAEGALRITEIPQRPLSPDLLDTNDCFILDLGQTGIYAWLGKGCSPQERKSVWESANKFLKQQQLPSWTPVQRVADGAEPAVFKAALHWSSDEVAPGQTVTTMGNNIARVSQEDHPVDVRGMHRLSMVPRAADFMPDDGKGNVTVWRVEKFFLAPVSEDTYGTFYGGDSYLVLYKYNNARGKQEAIMYFWQGNHSSLDEKAASAMLSVAIDEREFGGAAMQVRVTQNKEPAHFIAIFGGHITILMGGNASGFKNANSKDSYDTDGTRLFQVRNNKSQQVPEVASSLNSNDVFVLETPDKVYIWAGKGSNNQEEELSRELAKRVTHLRNTTMVKEGSEPDDFWQVLGGQADYASDLGLQKDQPVGATRLFQISNNKGYIYVEEIPDFTQEDLVEDDVMMLDTGIDVYVWIGDGANDKEKLEAMQMAKHYVSTDPDRKHQETTILVVRQNHEPSSFTGHFGFWDAELFQKRTPSGDLRKMLERENQDHQPSPEANRATETIDKALGRYSQTYPIDVLRGSDMPEGVDPTNKERHLSDSDFEQHFKMARAKYDALPKWKQLDLKKAAGLF